MALHGSVLLLGRSVHRSRNGGKSTSDLDFFLGLIFGRGSGSAVESEAQSFQKLAVDFMVAAIEAQTCQGGRCLA